MGSKLVTFCGIVVGIGVGAFYISPLMNPKSSVEIEPSISEEKSEVIQSQSPIVNVVRQDIEKSDPRDLHGAGTGHWWDDENLVDGYTNQFADEIGPFMTEFLLSCDKGEYGDLNIKVSRDNWGWFHPDMMPSFAMFEDLSQGEKWATSCMIQLAAINTREHGGVIREKLSVSQKLNLQAKLRNQALYYSPEFILNEGYGSDWPNNRYLAEEVRVLWIEMVRLAGPVETELNMRQRCAMGVLPSIDESQVNLISPGILEYELMMESLHQEFYDKVQLLIRDSRDAR